MLCPQCGNRSPAPVATHSSAGTTLDPETRRWDWSRLNKLQVGRYAEYFVKMEFTLLGFDVYSSEVDDRGIDFVIRREPDRYYDVQVKSSRGLNYIFFHKSQFLLRENLLAAIVLFQDQRAPELYLLP